MSRPDFAAILAKHRLTWWAVYHWRDEPGGSLVAPRCTCGVLWSSHATTEPAVQIASWESHLAATVDAAIDDWLTADETRNHAADAISRRFCEMQGGHAAEAPPPNSGDLDLAQAVLDALTQGDDQ